VVDLGLTGLRASRRRGRGARAWAWPLEIASFVRLRWREPDHATSQWRSWRGQRALPPVRFRAGAIAASHSPGDQPHAPGAHAAACAAATRDVVTSALAPASMSDRPTWSGPMGDRVKSRRK